MASVEEPQAVATSAQAAVSSLSNSQDNSEGVQSILESSIHNPMASSKAVEMSNLTSPSTAQEVIPSFSETTASPYQLQENIRPAAHTSIQPSNSSPQAESSSPSGITPNPVAPLPNLTREQTAPAIGPASDKPSPLAYQAMVTGPQLIITLLLHTGARHPYRIDEKYLKKRNVTVPDNNPVNMSVYTLKELIWREWREEWEPRPSSPSSIRLIHYGKMLDDKAHLKDGRFTAGETAHVVHMTIKPQDVVDDEDARIAKGGGRDRDGAERTPGCRCVIL